MDRFRAEKNWPVAALVSPTGNSVLQQFFYTPKTKDYNIKILEWPRRTLIRSEYASDGSYQISFDHNDHLIDPFIEVKVECPFGTAILKDSLPVYGGIIEKNFEFANSDPDPEYY